MSEEDSNEYIGDRLVPDPPRSIWQDVQELARLGAKDRWLTNSAATSTHFGEQSERRTNFAREVLADKLPKDPHGKILKVRLRGEPQSIERVFTTEPHFHRPTGEEVEQGEPTEGKSPSDTE